MVEAVEELIGYRFHDPELLRDALTLPSWHTEARPGTDNQRLEFLGDAVLGLLAAEHLYTTYHGIDEGGLSLLRAQITSGRALAEVARAMGLGALMRVGKSDERTGGRTREGALSDTLEALVGAVWLDGGPCAARGVFQRLLADRILADRTQTSLQMENPKGRLQERTQAADGSVPIYELMETVGPDHQPQYRVRVLLSNGVAAEAVGAGKRAAEAAAAQAALDALDGGDASQPPVTGLDGKPEPSEAHA